MATLSYSPTIGSWWTGTVNINYSVSYDASANQTTVTFAESSHAYFGRSGWGTSAATTISVTANDNTSSMATAALSTTGTTNGGTKTFTGTPTPVSVTVQHLAASTSKSVTIAGTTTVKVYATSTATSQSTATGSGSVTVSAAPDVSTIAAISQTVYTQNAVSISMNRAGSCYHKATFQVDGTVMAITDAFGASVSYTVPRSWFAGYPDKDSLTISVSVQTYTGQDCAAAIGAPAEGSFFLYADSGMKPVISSGFATIGPYNTGAAAGLSGYIQGISQAQVVFDSEKVDLSNTEGAGIAGYTVTAAGQTDDTEPYRTPVLTGATEIVCTVTDSRGRSASETLPVTPQSYSAPAITQIRVFRCDAAGAEDEDGTYLSAAATAVYSSLGGQNSVSLQVQYRTKGGSWSSAAEMTSGNPSIIGGTLSPDISYEVQISASDLLNTATAIQTLPARTWAMKFRPKGKGVAFGVVPEEDNALAIPEGWQFKIGEKTLLDIVYPVGTVYTSSNPTDPGTLFGGTWERIKDVFVLAAGDTYAIGANGGNPTHQHTLDAGYAKIAFNYSSAYANHLYQAYKYVPTFTAGQYWSGMTQYQTTDISETKASALGGTTDEESNMPPYITKYMWERTA